MTYKKKKIFLFIVMLLIIALIFIGIVSIYSTFFTDNYTILNNYNEPEYIYASKRTEKTIVLADDTYLDNHLSKAKNTLVIFFATWCPDCTNEADSLNNFISNNKDIPVIIVSHDKEYEKLDKYLNDNGYNWFVILDSKKTIREHIDPGSKGIPSAYLLNSNNEIISYSDKTLTENEFLEFYTND